MNNENVSIPAQPELSVKNDQAAMPLIQIKIPPAPVIGSESSTTNIQMKTLWYVGQPNALSNFNWPKRNELDQIIAEKKKIKLTGFSIKHTTAIQHF